MCVSHMWIKIDTIILLVGIHFKDTSKDNEKSLWMLRTAAALWGQLASVKIQFINLKLLLNYDDCKIIYQDMKNAYIWETRALSATTPVSTAAAVGRRASGGLLDMHGCGARRRRRPLRTRTRKREQNSARKRSNMRERPGESAHIFSCSVLLHI